MKKDKKQIYIKLVVDTKQLDMAIIKADLLISKLTKIEKIRGKKW